MKQTIALGLAVLLAGCCSEGDPIRRAEERLRHEVETAGGFRQVRAAEALGPTADFPVDSPDPQTRIGQYRVRIAAGRREYEAILRNRALDSSRPEQCHALESSAKLAIRFTKEEQDVLRAIVRDDNPLAAGYALWLLAVNDDAEANRQLTEELENAGPHLQTCAYACGFLPELSAGRARALRRQMEQAPANSRTGAFAAWALARHRRVTADLLREKLKHCSDEAVLRFYLEAMGEVGTAAEIPLLAGYLEEASPEVANAAAGALLRIARRN